VIEEHLVSDSPQTIRVNLAERSYDIAIGAGNLADAGRFLADRAKVTHVVLITDDNVHKPHAIQVAESIGLQEIDVDVICVEPGEESKSLAMAEGLWQGLLDLGADRKTVVAAVGGGVIGDLAGFIAATYARGLRFLQVPTSLLAQVDSSVGGKVGIDLPDAKNMVGAFLQPLGVLIDTAALATLPPREFSAGLGEVVKYGVILDAELFDYLETNAAALLAQDRGVLSRVITRCCRLKADVVEQDEHEESGLRAILNFGHTFGHAFETLSWHSGWSAVGSRQSALERGEGRGERGEEGAIPPSALRPPPSALLHGEAVAIGMVCAARLAQRLGRVDAAFTVRLCSLLETFELPVETPAFDPQQILDSTMHDKKVQHGRLSFVLPSRMGQVELVRDIAKEDILASIENK
jgi:3-dehydroquinate synthase